MKKLIFLITLFPGILLADDFKMCQKIASEINSSAPMTIDETTRLANAECTPSLKKETKVKLVYNYQILDGRVTKEDIPSRRPTVVNRWCSKPNMTFTLKAYDIEYIYSYVSGKYIASINLSIKDCE
mgnify:CR=1 FL=1|tara:strand:+ start:92 stop:472 length:381 start_codon:yes stop_codon:yes gene_type:complete